MFIVMVNKYTFIFEITWRDSESGQLKPHEYRKMTQMSIYIARVYARRLSNTQNVLSVRFYKEMY
jgi:hypothetical protein